MLSALYGYSALVTAKTVRYLKAVEQAGKAMSAAASLRGADEHHPSVRFANGLYEYMLSMIPAEFQGIARLMGLSGDRNKGLELLVEAAESNSFLAVDVRIILSQLPDTEMANIDGYIRELSKVFPRNPIYVKILRDMVPEADDHPIPQEVDEQLLALIAR